MGNRKFFRYFTVHPTLLFFVLVAIVTGTFVQLAIIISIVIIHELGHFILARYFKWRIDSIVLWAFGGIMKTDEYTTRPLREEIIVTLAGPLQHLFIYVIAKLLLLVNVIPLPIVNKIMYFNVIILIFNLLPIYPLDGGKLFLYILSFIIPYRLAYQSILLFSLIACFAIIFMQFLLFSFTLSATLLTLFLIVEIYLYWKNEYYTFLRFLLNRLYSDVSTYEVKNIYAKEDDRLIDIFNRFMRNKTHRIYISPKKYVNEIDSLHYYFYKNKHVETVNEIFNIH